MRTARAERIIPAPVEEVFDVVTDHAGYDRFRDITRSELVKEGDPPPNGTGAFRRLNVGRLLRFKEQITAFERPSRMDYLIVEVNAPIKHQGASIRLSETDGGARVEWTSTLQVPMPIVGGIQERLWSLAVARGFRRMLEDVERILVRDRR